MGDELEWRPSSMAFFVDGRQWAFNGAAGPAALPAAAAARAAADGPRGAAAAEARQGGRGRSSRSPRASGSSRGWAARRGARSGGRCCAASSATRAEDISMAWLWSKLTLRRQLEGDEARQEQLGYPAALVGAAVRRAARRDRGRRRARAHRPPGGARLRATATASFVVTPGAPGRSAAATTRGRSRAAGEPERYDAVVATVPNDVFLGLLDDDLAAAIGATTSTACARPSTTPRSACCSSSTAASRRSTGRTSPTRRCRSSASSSTRTSSTRSATAAGASSTSPTTSRPATRCSRSRRDELLDALHAGPARRSTRSSRATGSSSAGCTASPPRSRSSRSATTSASRRCETGVPGLVLANTTQIYPEDRGTNYTVRLGGDAARALLAQDVAAAAAR